MEDGVPILKVGHCSDLSHITSGITQCREDLGIAVVVPEEGNTDRLVLLAIYDSGKPDPHSLDPEVD